MSGKAEPTLDQVAQAWMRYISTSGKRGPSTVQTLISMTGQQNAITEIFHDAYRLGYAQRQLDETGGQR